MKEIGKIIVEREKEYITVFQGLKLAYFGRQKKGSLYSVNGFLQGTYLAIFKILKVSIL